MNKYINNHLSGLSRSLTPEDSVTRGGEGKKEVWEKFGGFGCQSGAQHGDFVYYFSSKRRSMRPGNYAAALCYTPSVLPVFQENASFDLRKAGTQQKRALRFAWHLFLDAGL